jgi:hypothetical protein
MEIYSPNARDISAYRQVILQHGSGYDKDGYYYYSQEGEGIGSFFGNLFKSAIPVISRGIKGAVAISKPHFKKAASEIVSSGSKRLLNKISGEIVKSVEQPKKKQKRRRRRI